MSIILEPEQTEELTEGWTEAELVDIEMERDVQTNYGLKDIVSLWFEFDNGKKLKEDCISYYAPNSDSKLSRFFRGMGLDLTEKIDAVGLLNKRYKVKVKKNTDSKGRVWDNIDGVQTL